MSTEFTLRFDTGNAAFDEGNGPTECARILHRVAAMVGDGFRSGTMRDVNGNAVGQWAVDFPETDDEDGEG